MDALSMLVDLIEGMSEEQLARVCRGAQVRVNGFRNLSKAPRPLLVSAVQNASRTSPAVGRELVREWGEAQGDFARACAEQGARLAEEGTDPDLVAWVRQLCAVHGRTRALQAMVYTAQHVPALAERLAAAQVNAALKELQEEPDQAGPEEPPAPVAAPAAADQPPTTAQVPEPPPAVVTAPEPVLGEAIASAKAGRLAAQVKELQQQLKALRADKTALERRLETTENRLSSFRDEALRLRAENAALKAGQEYPEPKERVKRLVEALFEALREADTLRGALEGAERGADQAAGR